MNDAAAVTKVTSTPVDGWRSLLHALMGQVDIVGVLFFILLTFAFFVMWRWQRDDSVAFDIRDVVMMGGHVSADRMKEWGAFLAMTFVLIHEEYAGTLSEWLFSGYGLVWVAKGITNVWKRNPLPDKEDIDAKP